MPMTLKEVFLFLTNGIFRQCLHLNITIRIQDGRRLLGNGTVDELFGLILWQLELHKVAYALLIGVVHGKLIILQNE